MDKQRMNDQQIEHLIQSSLFNDAAQVSPKGGTFFTIQDRLGEQGNSALRSWLQSSPLFSWMAIWRNSPMIKKRIAQSVVAALVIAVIGAYIAILGNDASENGSIDGVAAGGETTATSPATAISEPEPDSSDNPEATVTLDPSQGDSGPIEVFPTIAPPPASVDISEFSKRVLSANLESGSSLSDSELMIAWTSTLTASRLLFTDDVSGQQDWRMCGNHRGVIVDDQSGGRTGTYFSWDLDVADGVARFGVDLDLDDLVAFGSPDANATDSSAVIVADDGVMLFDLGQTSQILVIVMDASAEATKCPEYAPAPPGGTGVLGTVDSVNTEGTAVPPAATK